MCVYIQYMLRLTHAVEYMRHSIHSLLTNHHFANCWVSSWLSVGGCPHCRRQPFHQTEQRYGPRGLQPRHHRLPVWQGEEKCCTTRKLSNSIGLSDYYWIIGFTLLDYFLLDYYWIFWGLLYYWTIIGLFMHFYYIFAPKEYCSFGAKM